MDLSAIIFYATAALIVFSAFRVVTSQSIFHSALYLALTLSALAVNYLLLHAEFVAVVQILVYVGAVIILIIFAVMLTAQMGDARVSQTNRLALPALALCALLFYALRRVLLSGPWATVAPAPADAAAAVATGSNLQSVGRALLGSYVYPFEIIGLILFTALVGAVLIARKDPE